jgi:hypothetical protein
MGKDWKVLPEGEKKSYPVLGKRKASETQGPTGILQSVEVRGKKWKTELYENMTRTVHISSEVKLILLV